jgi:hypothetical protein
MSTSSDDVIVRKSLVKLKNQKCRIAHAKKELNSQVAMQTGTEARISRLQAKLLAAQLKKNTEAAQLIEKKLSKQTRIAKIHNKIMGAFRRLLREEKRRALQVKSEIEDLIRKARTPRHS